MRDPFYRGDGERFLVNREKKKATENLVEKVFEHFIPVYNYILLLEKEAAEDALVSHRARTYPCVQAELDRRPSSPTLTRAHTGHMCQGRAGPCFLLAGL
jgi:hypothetical protein